MSDFEQPVEPMSRAEAILRKYGGITPMSRVEALLKELVDESGGSSVTVTPVLSEGVRLATIGVDGTDYNIYAPEDVVGSIVSVTTEYNTGTLLATITVNDVDHYIYVPEANNILSGTNTPSANVGEDNDIFIKYDGVNTERSYTRIASISMGSAEYHKTVTVDLTPDYYHLKFASRYAIANSIIVLKQDVYPRGSVKLIYGYDNVTFTINGNSISINRSEYNGNTYDIYASVIESSVPTNINTPYAKLNGKWFPFPDKGNVEDVYINGASVLDENDIAQIKSYQEITKAEYDALPSSKLTDDVLYCITDGGAAEPGEYFNPVIYSTTEREVGVWTDGKPLYQKTINIGTLNTAGTPKKYNHGIANIDKIIYQNAFAINQENGRTIAIPYTDVTENYNQCISVDTTEISIWSGVDRSMYVGYVTIQYTKTTDTPGSGKYTTLGVPSVHYSTDEQVIGTWIDGKPLYQKTVEVTSITGSAWNSYLVDADAVIRYIEGWYGDASNNLPLNYFNGSVMMNRTSDGARGYFSLYGSGTISKATVTVRYTKTTD